MSDLITAPTSNTTGNFTPGAAFSMQMIAAILNATWNFAQQKDSDFQTLMNSITNQSTGWLATTAAPQITAPSAVGAPTVSEPSLTIPSSIDTASVLSDYRTEYETLMTEMAGKWSSFMAANFADDSTLYGAAEDWIAAAMSGNGIPATVQAQLLSDDEARISAEASQSTDTLRQSFAALRYALPPGAMASAQAQIQQKAQNLMAESGRKIVTVSIDTMRFAIEKAQTARELAINATADYVKTLIMSPDISSKVIGIGLDAQPKLISAVSSLMGARTEVQRLLSSVSQFNVTTDLQVKEKNQAASMEMIGDRLKALIAQCQMLAQEMTASLNNMHISGGSSYNVNGT